MSVASQGRSERRRPHPRIGPCDHGGPRQAAVARAERRRPHRRIGPRDRVEPEQVRWWQVALTLAALGALDVAWGIWRGYGAHPWGLF